LIDTNLDRDVGKDIASLLSAQVREKKESEKGGGREGEGREKGGRREGEDREKGESKGE
jgi:hypothetical protein